MARSAVFALCVRPSARDLPGVLGNLEALSSLYDRSAFVFVEDDASEADKAIVRDWAASRPEAAIVRMDGPAGTQTERLAACRNAYMDHIRRSPLASYDHLVVLDAGEINSKSIDLESFDRARDWLEQNHAAAGFANSQPFYHDIWALRHPTWCPGDIMAEIERERPTLGKAAAEERYCFSRQIPIAPTAAPIDVQSAYGGLAIYRMGDALDARYVGRTEDGRQVCEHVAFNLDVGRSGRRLAILPWMTVGARFLGVALRRDSRQLSLTQGRQSCVLTAPPDHAIDRFRTSHPLYDRRLPVLARLTGEAVPDGVAIDVGANIGDTIALCRLEGSTLRFIAVEAALSYVKYLYANQRALPQLFHDVAPSWTFIGRPGETTKIELHHGTAHRSDERTGGESHDAAPVSTLEQVARGHRVTPGRLSLVKLDTDGYDHTILLNELEFLKREQPILWAEAETWRAEDDAGWNRLMAEAAETWPYMIAFDNLGFALFAGPTAKKRRSFMDMLTYTRRRRTLPKKQFGGSTIHYLDVALFPERFARVFEAFKAELPELADG